MAKIRGTAGDDTGVNALLGGGEDDTIRGLAGNDFLGGGGGDDRLLGGEGNDILEGGNGDDVLRGEDGNDLALIGGRGDDIIDGGFGFDELEYGNDPGGIDLDLLLGTATDGFGDTDTLISIESIIGSQFDDRILGDNISNYINGLGGNDFIDGREGADILAYAGSPSGIEVDMRAGTAKDGFGTTDTILNFEEIVGSAFNDKILGDDDDNGFLGQEGDDIIRGRGGNDTLTGDSGDDRLDGGAGKDWVRFPAASTGVDVDLARGTAEDGTGGTDTLISIENVLGTQFNDQISGDGEKNILLGAGGDDLLLGQGGNDEIDGGAGDDIIQGGGGKDTIIASAGMDDIDGGRGRDLFLPSEEIVNLIDPNLLAIVNLNTGVFSVSNSQDSASLTKVENVRGSLRVDGELREVQFQMNITGTDGKNKLVGGAGDDIIRGGGGNDVLDGASGRDTLNGGSGRDKFTGGGDGDTFQFTGNWGRGTITDFELAGSTEVISIAGEVQNFNGFRNAASQVGDDVVYDLGDDGENVIIIKNTLLSDMRANDLDFA